LAAKNLPRISARSLRKIVLYLNSGNANPPADMKSWLKCQGSGKTMDATLAQFPHDIYAFGTQVCNT